MNLKPNAKSYQMGKLFHPVIHPINGCLIRFMIFLIMLSFLAYMVMALLFDTASLDKDNTLPQNSPDSV